MLCTTVQPNEEEEVVTLLPEEIAVLELIDLQDLEQEQAAAVLGVSRKTIWRDIHETHRKIADALIHGKSIQMAGCTRELEGYCPQSNLDICPKRKGVGFVQKHRFYHAENVKIHPRPRASEDLPKPTLLNIYAHMSNYGTTTGLYRMKSMPQINRTG